MDATAPSLVSVLVAWLPLALVLIVFFGVVWRSQKSYARHVQDVIDVNQALVDLNREMLAELKTISNELKDRKP